MHTADEAVCTVQTAPASAQQPDAVQSQSAPVQQVGPTQGPTRCHTFVLLSVLPVKSPSPRSPVTAVHVRAPSVECGPDTF